MTYSYGIAVNNARLEAIETATAGLQPKFQIWTGSHPAVDAASTGTKLLDILIPADWMGNAAAGSKAKAGTWSGAAVAAGTAGYFRIRNNGDTATIIQGAIGADMTLDNTNIGVGQTVTINTFTINSANL